MPLIDGLLSIPGAFARVLGTVFYTFFVTVPYTVASALGSGFITLWTAALTALSALASLPGIIVRGAISFFSAGFNLFSAAFSTVAAVVTPYAVLALNSIASAFNSYITYMNAFNASLANFFAPVANFFAPLLARAPWLATVARFFQPLARLAPVFNVLQGVLLLASVPYVTAAGAGLVVAAYSTVARFFSNLGVITSDYFFEDEELPSVSHQFRENSVLVAVVTSPFVALARAALVIAGATIFNAFDSLSIGKQAFSATYQATLDLPIFQVMRSAWKGHRSRLKTPVSDAEIRWMRDDISVLNAYFGKQETRTRRGTKIAFSALDDLADLKGLIGFVPARYNHSTRRATPAMATKIDQITREIADLKQQNSADTAAIKQELRAKLEAAVSEIKTLGKFANDLAGDDKNQRDNLDCLADAFAGLLNLLNDDAHFNDVEVAFAAGDSETAPEVKTVAVFTPQARQALKASHARFINPWYGIDAEAEEEQVATANAGADVDSSAVRTSSSLSNTPT